MKSFVLVAVGKSVQDSNFTNRLQDVLKKSQLPFEERYPPAKIPTLLLTINPRQFDSGHLKEDLTKLAEEFKVDIALTSQSLFETKKKLVVFDMDSTLITAEVIDEMAELHGVAEKVKAITLKAMNGELNFDQSLTQRLSMLKGFHRSDLEKIKNALVFTPGTEEFIRILKSRNIKTAIASGGFHYFAEYVKNKLGMDYAFSNQLDFDDDALSGKMTSSILNAETKQTIIKNLASENNLTLDEVVAIGDGANDIPMLLTAGTGIAIHAKEKVRKAAHYAIQFNPMTAALSYMNEWE